MRDLDDLLEDYSVYPPGEHTGPRSWWAVADTDGVIACFSEERAAFRFRLAEINRKLNG